MNGLNGCPNQPRESSAQNRSGANAKC